MNDADINTQELDVIRRRWATSYDRGAHDYTDEGCRILAERAFKDVRILFAALDRLVNELSSRTNDKKNLSLMVEAAEAALRDAQTELAEARRDAARWCDECNAAEAEVARLTDILYMAGTERMLARAEAAEAALRDAQTELTEKDGYAIEQYDRAEKAEAALQARAEIERLGQQMYYKTRTAAATTCQHGRLLRTEHCAECSLQFGYCDCPDCTEKA